MNIGNVDLTIVYDNGKKDSTGIDRNSWKESAVDKKKLKRSLTAR